jgi:hypothetical protein
MARTDKWYLSAGDGFLWAPPFPRWLHRPGFWDEGHVYHYPVQPLFSVALVGPDGEADPLEGSGSDWRPDRLRVRWQSRAGLRLTEFRYVLPGGRFCSAWRTEEELGWPNPVFRERSLVAFTIAPGPSVHAVHREGSGLRWRSTLRDRRDHPLHVEAHLGFELFPPRGRRIDAPEVVTKLELSLEDACCGGLRSEVTGDPDWNLTPFVEGWRDRLHGLVGLGLDLPGDSEEGCVHLVTALPLRNVPARHAVGFVCTVLPVPADGRVRSEVRPGVPPRPHQSELRWCSALASYPRFSCTDPYLSAYFDYRLYGLHLARLDGGLGRIPYPTVAGGIAAFHLPNAPSAPGHMAEARWCAQPDLARGVLLNFLEAQRLDGSLPGRLHLGHDAGEGLRHANWGDAVLAVDALHPQQAFLETAYGGLSRYAAWLIRERDPEGSGMITLATQEEAGQAYTSRFVRLGGSLHDPAGPPRLGLKGIDVTVFHYQLLRALEGMADRLGYADEAGVWRDWADATGAAIRDRMWDPDLHFFTDVDVETGAGTGVKAGVGFYPLLTDLLDPDHLAALLRHLDDPGSFATPFPVPSSPADDPLFDAEGLWRGKRHRRPWNGRVWPTINSHVVDGLLRQWHRGRTEVGPAAARILGRGVRMMFHRDDPGRPNAYEHYNPRSGHPSAFRGLDDHQHFWVVDLMVRGVAGIEPSREGLTVRPLPMGLDRVTFRGRILQHDVDVTVDGPDVVVSVDGHTTRGRTDDPVPVAW